MRFQKHEFSKNLDFPYANFWIKYGFLPLSVFVLRNPLFWYLTHLRLNAMADDPTTSFHEFLASDR